MFRLPFSTKGRLMLATTALLFSIVVNGVLAFKVVKNGLDVEVARDQVETFETVLSRASHGEVAEREGVEYISIYYPEGTRLSTGSQLSAIVEAARRIALEKASSF